MGSDVDKDRIARLMRELGIRGATRSKSTITTRPDGRRRGRRIWCNRRFRADRPNQLWVSDFTYVATWSGFVYTAFVIDVFSRTHRRLAHRRVDDHRARDGRVGDGGLLPPAASCSTA